LKWCFRYRQLIGMTLTETNPVSRTAYFQEADRILVEDEVAVIPIHGYERATLVKSDVIFEYPPFGAPHLMKWELIYYVYLPVILRNG
jgi:hypothetical protein